MAKFTNSANTRRTAVTAAGVSALGIGVALVAPAFAAAQDAPANETATTAAAAKSDTATNPGTLADAYEAVNLPATVGADNDPVADTVAAATDAANDATDAATDAADAATSELPKADGTTAGPSSDSAKISSSLANADFGSVKESNPALYQNIQTIQGLIKGGPAKIATASINLDKVPALGGTTKPGKSTGSVDLSKVPALGGTTKPGKTTGSVDLSKVPALGGKTDAPATDAPATDGAKKDANALGSLSGILPKGANNGALGSLGASTPKKVTMADTATATTGKSDESAAAGSAIDVAKSGVTAGVQAAVKEGINSASSNPATASTKAVQAGAKAGSSAVVKDLVGDGGSADSALKNSGLLKSSSLGNIANVGSAAK